MKTTTEILDETLVNIEAARYRVTTECFYSETLRIHTKILEAAAFLTNAIKETKSDDAQHPIKHSDGIRQTNPSSRRVSLRVRTGIFASKTCPLN